MTEPLIVLFKELWVLTNTPYPKIPNLRVSNFNMKDVREADAFCTMNIDNPYSLNAPKRNPVYREINTTGKPVLVIESPVFRQNIILKRYAPNTVHRFGWDHFLNIGKFNNANSPSDRWEYFSKKQNLALKEWRDLKEHNEILIPLQKANDSSLISMIKKWGSQEAYLEWIVKELRYLYPNPIVIRPHPLYENRTKIDLSKLGLNVFISSNLRSSSTANGGEGLAKDLEKVFFVVGYNSNTLIETIMAGIPTVTIDKEAHSYSASLHSVRDIFLVDYRKSREQWLYDLSYTQWTHEEMENGKAWEHIKGVYF